MAAGNAEGERPPEEPRRGCIGCLTAVVGLFSGAMIAVFVGLMVRYVTNGPKCPDVPICNWHEYAAVGALLGVITLPVLTFLRLRHARAEARSSDRG
jgi:hypothetical protein